MDEKTVTELLQSVGEAFESNADFLCRNLIECIFMTIEFKDEARKSGDEEFWSLSKTELLNLENIKNVRVKDILYFTDSSFRGKVNKFFSLIMEHLYLHYKRGGMFFEMFLEWLLYLSECKIREFRNLAGQILLEISTSTFRVVSNHMTSIRESKSKAGEWVFLLVKMLDSYYPAYIRTRIFDVESAIRVHLIDHLLEVINNKYCLHMDEAAVVVGKRNGEKSVLGLNMFLDNMLTCKCLKHLMEGMTEPHVERVCKYMGAVSTSIGKMKGEIDDSNYKEWFNQGNKILSVCVDTIKHVVPHMIKAMVELREETGVHIINFFSSVARQPLFEGVLSTSDHSLIFFMVTSAKKKLKDAACDFIFDQIGKKDSETSLEEEREIILRFIKVIHDVMKTIAAKKCIEYEFEEESTLWIMRQFLPKICLRVDHKTLVDMYLGGEEIEFGGSIDNIKGYVGCCLISVLRSTEMVSKEDVLNQKQMDEFKGDVVDNIKTINASIKTSVKESMKKNLTVKNLKNDDDLSVYLKLVEMFVGDADQSFTDTISNLYDKLSNKKALKRLATILRSLLSVQSLSQIEKDYLMEKLQKLFDGYIQTFNSCVGKLQKEIQDKGLNRSHSAKLVDELKFCLRKLTPLKDLFQIKLEMGAESIKNLELIIDLFINSKLTDREIFEHSITLLRNSTIELYFKASTSPAENEGFKGLRKEAVENFFHLIEPSCLMNMDNTSKDHGLTRYIFIHLTELLKVISNDQVIFIDKTYFNIAESDDYLNKIWGFVDSYLFKPESNKERMVAEGEEQDTNKAVTSGMEEEEGKSRSKKRNSATIEEGGRETKCQLRSEDLLFRENAYIIVSVVLNLSLNLFRSIGCNLASRLFYKLLNLKSQMDQFAKPMESFLDKLVEREKIQPKMVLWKFVDSCIKPYDLQTLKAFSRMVFSFFKKYSANEELVKGKYFPFCVFLLTWAQESPKEPHITTILSLFIKKNILGEETTNKLLYGTQHTLQKYMKDSNISEIDILEDEKYIHLRAIRDVLASICQKNLKDDNAQNEGGNTTAKKGRRSKSVKMVAEGENDQEGEGIDSVHVGRAVKERVEGEDAKKKGKKPTEKGMGKTKRPVSRSPEDGDIDERNVKRMKRGGKK